MAIFSDAAVYETEMIRQAQRGDECAFEEIYRKHRRRVYSVCARITRNSAEAEDLTQETFLQRQPLRVLLQLLERLLVLLQRAWQRPD